MRLKVAGLGRVVKRDLGIEFGREQLTSYGGLERRFVAPLGKGSLGSFTTGRTRSGKNSLAL